MAARNAMEVFKLLDQSNCRQCGEKTCLAFAGAVYTGKRRLHDCLKLMATEHGAQSLSADPEGTGAVDQAEEYGELVEQVVALDFPATARRIGGRMKGSALTVALLGKDFTIHRDGTFSTDLHIIPWVVAPLLEYVLHCKGLEVADDWISFREIDGGREQYALFRKRGEEVFKQLADAYPDFFDDIVHMFNGRKVEERFEADVSVVLHPLPLVPLMLCYWRAEGGLHSSFNLYFDRTVSHNLGVDSTFLLGVGLAQMFQKLAQHHAW